VRLALVTCFNADWHHGRVPAPYIPLNLLSLAAGLRQAGHAVAIIDQTRALLQGQATDGPEFHDQIARLIYATQPDVVGLTTMCNSYPQSLRLARHYRRVDPAAKIVLGGPQATVVAHQTLDAFPWIDAIVRNEADLTFPELVGQWGRGQSLAAVAGITWRDSAGRVQHNASADLLQDLDRLPFPAYDLYPLDPADPGLIPIEAGRGCPYGCTFCSTNLYFNRRYRIKSPQRLLTEMRVLYETYGVTRFDLVHDMLTVDRRWVADFCHTLLETGAPFQWGCSARVDRVDSALLATMAAAGCLGIFFGIETGSPRLQPVVKKKLAIDTVLPVLRTCVEQGIVPTASFITGFPTETAGDAIASFHLALDVLQLAPQTLAQMHMLAPLVGSPLYQAHRHELQIDGHSSDISLFLLTDEELALVRTYPDIFPNFYYIPTPHLDRAFTKAVSAATYTCPDLFIALRYAGADLEAVLAGWVTWQRAHVPADRLGQDYYLYRFGLDLCAYLRAAVVPALIAATPCLPDLLAYVELRYALERGYLRERTTFRRFDYDVVALTRALRANLPALPAARQPTSLLFVNLTFAPARGFAYLEVNVPPAPHPLIRPGDVLEIRDVWQQLQRRPDLIIRNNTQKRAFAAKHHLTEPDLQRLGLARDA
jgi:radical SAM superfamily enzyme YgiQ (UPF0313 family)